MLLFEHIISIIAPHACLSCRSEGTLLCTACLRALPATESPVQRGSLAELYVRTEYHGVAKELIHRLKFERARAAAEPVAQALIALVPTRELQDSIVTYVPTASSRARMRGYDQSSLIARAFARQLGLPYAPLLLRQTQTRQVGHGRQERLKQMHNAFLPVRRQLFAGKKVLLIDDVITTGATIESAARALRAADASHVTAIAFARAGSDLV